MSILFDSSSGEKQYIVYLVDRSKQPERLDWAPKAGFGFRDHQTSRLKRLPAVFHRFLPFRPMDWQAPDFRPAGTRFGEHWLQRLPGPPLGLSRYTGFFHIPETWTFANMPEGGHSMQPCTGVCRAIRPNGKSSARNFSCGNRWKKGDAALFR